MAINVTINTTETKDANQRQFNIEYQKRYGAIVPIIDGVKRPDLMAGYSSEADAQAYMDLLNRALEYSDGNVAGAKQYIMNAMREAAEKLEREQERYETVTVGPNIYRIDYENLSVTLGDCPIIEVHTLDTDDKDEIKRTLLAMLNTLINS